MATHIQIGNVAPRVHYTTDGVQMEYIYPFPIFKNDDLKIYVGTVQQSTGFTIVGAGNSAGGSVIFDEPPTASAVVTLVRRLEVQRTSDFQESGEFRSKVINDELDYLTAALQQVADDQGRSMQLAITQVGVIDTGLPSPAANTSIIWNDTADGFTNGPTVDEVVHAQSYATNAEASAAAAQLVYENFDSRYLGTKTTNPIVDNDGADLADGALYFDTTNAVMKVYDLSGTVWTQLTPTPAQQIAIDTVVADAADIDTVVANVADIGAVAGDIANVNTVAGDIAIVNTVAGISTEIGIAAANAADITNFADVYQGPHAVAPTVRNDSSPLLAGDMYFDTTADTMMVNDGVEWSLAYADITGAAAASTSQAGLVELSTEAENISGTTDNAVPTVASTAHIIRQRALFVPFIREWVERETPSTGSPGNQWHGICWSSELMLFCACRSSGASGDTIMTSPDGITWSIQTQPVANYWNAVCWSPELSLFCAVASQNYSDQVMTSPDGITWTTVAGQAGSWQDICWSPELMLFCAVGGSDGAMTSPDGINWTSIELPVPTAYGVCWSPERGLFCTVGGGAHVATSSDGINWTDRSGVVWAVSICWSPELMLFCAVGTSGFMTSPDGINWTSSAEPVDINWEEVCWSPEFGLFCAVAHSGIGNAIATSPDGVTWTTRKPPVDTLWRGVCWSPELMMFCGVHDASTTGVMTSL